LNRMLVRFSGAYLVRCCNHSIFRRR
jgi:hypothetical protein